MPEIYAKTPVWFWIASGLGLIWNMIGVSQYIWQVTATPEALEAVYSAAEMAIIEAQPAWYTAVFAVAVFSGVLGCLGLLLRKKWALWALGLSLICVILQNIYFLMAGVYAHIHGGAWVMTLMIPAIAIALVWIAKHMSTRGILK